METSADGGGALVSPSRVIRLEPIQGIITFLKDDNFNPSNNQGYGVGYDVSLFCCAVNVDVRGAELRASYLISAC